MPVRYPLFFRIWITIAVWYWCVSVCVFWIVRILTCNLVAGQKLSRCGSVIFLITLTTLVLAKTSSQRVGGFHCRAIYFLSFHLVYYTTALPAIMLFVLTERFWTAIAQVAQLVFLLVFVIPVQHIYARNVVSFVSLNNSLGIHAPFLTR